MWPSSGSPTVGMHGSPNVRRQEPSSANNPGSQRKQAPPLSRGYSAQSPDIKVPQNS